MKKIFTSASALLLMTVAAKSQAPRYVLFEHFTQASCGPCAAQNPGFESTILTPNPDKVRHIAFHTSWPGFDPMYNLNPSEPDARVSFYGVTGVPDVFMNGNQKNGQPGAFSQTDVDDQFSLGSPIKIKVTEVDNGADRDVTIEVITVGTVPAGSYKLYAAVVENPVTYGTPPGSNGETHFPNVFRKMLPAIAGAAFTPAALGASTTVTYNYVENAAWDMANVKVVAYVQNTATKEVLNSGTILDPVINYTLGVSGASSAGGATGAPSSFNLTSINSGTASEDFVYTLTSNAPGDWAGDFSVNGTPYTSTGTVTTAAGTTNNIVINVTPGTTPFVATYTLTVSSTSSPSSPVLTKKVNVISGVTDLIVNNTGGLGSGAVGNASAWEAVYTSGLTYAGNTGTAITTDVITKDLGASSALGGVNNIYYNVGWTFPSITDDEIPGLEDFLDNGGNMFIAGQDLGWEIKDAASTYGTTANRAFYDNYIHGGFSNDGGAANTQLSTVTTDLVYGGMPNAAITAYYGASYFYPDELTTAGGGMPIFRYNATTKIGGLRYYAGNYKIVYLGVGPEMLNTTNANNAIKIAHDWFYGIITGVEADNLFEQALSVYPNPANGVLNIAGLQGVTNVTVYDMVGNMLVAKQLNAGTQVLDLSAYQSGNYMVRFNFEDGSIANKKITLVK